MKNIILSLLVFATFASQATVRTVNNNPSGLAQFSNLQSCMDASSTGDTIYLHGSTISYGNAGISNKKLTIIGPGMNPDKTIPLTAKVNYLSITNSNGLSTAPVYGADGSAVIGLEVVAIGIGEGSTYTHAVHNIKILRNKFTYGLIVDPRGNYSTNISSNIYVEGNYFQNAGILFIASSIYQNFTIENNVFYKSVDGSNPYGMQNCINATNVNFNHNLFYGVSSVTNKDCFQGNNTNLNVLNTIFINRNPANNITNSSFLNNLTYNCTGSNTPWLSGGNLNVGGNIANQNPQMVSQIDIDNGVDNPLLDFTIASGMANNEGSDGKDMGLLFDNNTTRNWAYSRMSRLPYINTLTLLNPSVLSGGIMNFQINARKAK